MRRGERLELLLDDERGIRDIPQAAEAAGFAAEEAVARDGYWSLTIEV